MQDFTVYSIFQSGMVLQQQKPIRIWGTAPQSSIVTVQLIKVIKEAAEPVCVHTVTASANADNSWRCKMPACEAGEGYSLLLSCDADNAQSILLEQVSIGEVWLACGQSNMEFFLRYDKDWESIRQYEKNPHIHMYNVPQLAFAGQQKDTTGWGKWFTEGEQGFETFSAPGYSFARHIQPQLDVPIGIIGCNWGGTTASAWLDEAYLAHEPLNIYLQEYEAALQEYPADELEQISLNSWEFEVSEKHSRDFIPLMYGQSADWQEQYMLEHAEDPVIPMGPWSINRPGGLYHQMLKPLAGFSIKGALWYQGESDAYHADIYDQLLAALITCWRHQWHDDFPFLFVQLAPFGRWLQCDSTGYCQMRAVQERISKTVPDTAMTSIMDIGSYYDIHPKAKMEVGRRLALLARGHVYGEAILCDPPELVSARIEYSDAEAHSHTEASPARIILSFSHCQKLAVTKLSSSPLDVPMPQEKERSTSYTKLFSTGEIKGFRLLQGNTEIPISSIQLQDQQVILHADIRKRILCAVSLAWADYAVVNLVNETGLPVKPFVVTV